METSHIEDLIGQTLDGRFEILSEIDRGSMGVVYRGWQHSVGRAVAIKCLIGQSDPKKIARFESEAQVLSRLRHPNSLAIIETGRTPSGCCYIVSPLLEGHSLADVLVGGPLSPRRVQRILIMICNALTEAHTLGIVHRDLKPANIFLEQVGQTEVVRVIDYGIAVDQTTTAQHTAEGMAMGTATYMSPEQIHGDPLDGRSDLYSLGVLAYECLAGEPPFVGIARTSVLVKHLRDAPPPVQDRCSQLIPEALAEVVMTCLMKTPADRYVDATDLRMALEDALLDPIQRLPKPIQWQWFAAVGVLIGLGGLGWYLHATSAPTPPLSAAPAKAVGLSVVSDAEPPSTVTLRITAPAIEAPPKTPKKRVLKRASKPASKSATKPPKGLY